MNHDEIELAMEENIRLGYIEITGYDDDGEPFYRMTEAGKERVEAMGQADGDQ